jgi:uncharacterized BrkB/YihY/UPF0761 family membrane protein
MRRHIVISTIVLWAIATGVYAFIYISETIALPDAEGYEKLWDWQLFFFSLVRGPILLVLLLVVLWLEYRFLPDGRT